MWPIRKFSRPLSCFQIMTLCSHSRWDQESFLSEPKRQSRVLVSLQLPDLKLNSSVIFMLARRVPFFFSFFFFLVQIVTTLLKQGTTSKEIKSGQLSTFLVPVLSNWVHFQHLVPSGRQSLVHVHSAKSLLHSIGQ